jgi:pimeloyl-ACP methyl ester carboxylesterase
LSQVLIVHGKNDALVPYRNSRKLAQIIPDAEFATLSACGHNPQVHRGAVTVLPHTNLCAMPM